MAHITREELEIKGGQGRRLETYQDQSELKTYKPPPVGRRDIRGDIYNALYFADQPMSYKAIAESLDLKRSPWLRGHINDLLSEGYLTRIDTSYKNGLPMFLYEAVR